MSLPTSGYTPTSIDYAADVELTGLTAFGFGISIDVANVGGAAVAEQIAGVLDTALAGAIEDIVTATSASSATLNKSIRGVVDDGDIS